MSSSPADVQSADLSSSSAGQSNFQRRAFLILGAVALIYALLAGLRTASDFDLGWQLATGRWVVQHHAVPYIDVLSYTAAGEPWTYPVGAGVIFYGAYLLGGYGLISWMGALACAGTIALLLRRGSAVTAALAIVAVPLIALRTTPRADMFTVVLFAAFLSLLWEQHRSGRAALWLLPPLMLAWVNLHFGFAAGLGLIAAYVGVELLQVIFDRANRRDAIARLRRARIWLLSTVLVTLLNPWGWGIYRALLLQQRANNLQQSLITEWGRVPLSWAAVQNAIWLRQTGGAIYWLLAIALVAALLALWRAQWGAAILLLAASYPAVRSARMGALFACVVVVVASPLLSSAIAELASRLRPARVRWMATAAVVLFVVLASLRGFDLITNRHYVQGADETVFGPGVSWWFPQRAAAFIERENLPGEIFNSYNEGGYLAWRLGPQRLAYIDGRDTLFGVQRIRRQDHLLRSSPDSSDWQQEAARYNLNTVILSLARYDGIQLVQLHDYCASTLWQPVYLDEVSAVFVRRTPQTDELRRRFPVNCATAPLPAQPPNHTGAEAFNSWSNAAAVLAALDRNSEALAAIDKAIDLFPNSAFAHWLRGSLLAKLARPDESLDEYLAAVALDPSDVTWAALADAYRSRGRNAEAIDAMKRAAAFSARPFSVLSNLGYLYLKTNQPADALRAFDEAESSAPRNIKTTDNATFDFMLAQGRSVAWNQLGDVARAITFQEQATGIEPDSPEPWRRLAKLYRQQGRSEDASRAEERAAAALQKDGR
jgi:tetratricopeptide (TPR) repeat protein